MDNIKLLNNTIPLKSELYTNLQYNNIRRNKILIFGEILSKYAQFKELKYDAKHALICDLERSCYNAAIDKTQDLIKSWTNSIFENLYHHICFNVISNLDPDSDVNSRYLGDSILNDKILPHLVGKLSSRELCPEKYIEYDENINKRSNSASIVKTTELYTCHKCKRKQCTLENVINRSIDEGTSLVVHCMFCGNSWNG
jgi:DNA-directed RNA polymerase subunit M/transcription elongation factor TFIIS